MRTDRTLVPWTDEDSIGDLLDRIEAYVLRHGKLPAALYLELRQALERDAYREALERIAALTVLQPGKPGTQAAREIAAAALERSA